MTPNRSWLTMTTSVLTLVFASHWSFAKDLKPTSFRAAYEMMVDADEVTPVPACASASAVVFEDARADANVGQRYHEKKPDIKLPITMTGDAASWAQAGFRELARRAVLNTASPEKPRVIVRVASLWVDEAVYHNAEYDGRIVLDVSVDAATSTCWSGRVDGFAENYGRAGKEVNYQETVNHALDKAVLQILSSSQFTEALCSCTGGESHQP